MLPNHSSVVNLAKTRFIALINAATMSILEMEKREICEIIMVLIFWASVTLRQKTRNIAPINAAPKSFHISSVTYLSIACSLHIIIINIYHNEAASTCLGRDPVSCQRGSLSMYSQSILALFELQVLQITV